MKWLRIIRAFGSQFWLIPLFGGVACLFYVFALMPLFSINVFSGNSSFFAAQFINGNLFLGFMLGLHLRTVFEGPSVHLVPGFRASHLLFLVLFGLPVTILPPLLMPQIGDGSPLAWMCLPPYLLGLWFGRRWGLVVSGVPIMVTITLNVTAKAWAPWINGAFDITHVMAVNLACLPLIYAVAHELLSLREGEKALVFKSEDINNMQGGWRPGKMSNITLRIIERILPKLSEPGRYDFWSEAKRMEVALASPGHRGYTMSGMMIAVVAMVIVIHWPVGVAQELEKDGLMAFYAHTGYLTMVMTLVIDFVQHRPRLLDLWLISNSDRARFGKLIYASHALLAARQFVLVTILLLLLHLIIPIYTVGTFVVSVIYGGLATAAFILLELRITTMDRGVRGLGHSLAFLAMIVGYIFSAIFFLSLHHLGRMEYVFPGISVALLLFCFLLYSTGIRAWSKREFPGGDEKILSLSRS